MEKTGWEFAADIVVQSEGIAIHFYKHDGKKFRKVESKKCSTFSEAFDFLFLKGSSGCFLEFIIYLEDATKTAETNEFLKRAQTGLNWVVINGGINAGIERKAYVSPHK